MKTCFKRENNRKKEERLKKCILGASNYRAQIIQIFYLKLPKINEDF